MYPIPAYHPLTRGARIRVSWRPVLRQLFRDISLTPFPLSILHFIHRNKRFIPPPPLLSLEKCNNFPSVHTFLSFSQRKFKNYKYKAFEERVRFITSLGYGVWIGLRGCQRRDTIISTVLSTIGGRGSSNSFPPIIFHAYWKSV